MGKFAIIGLISLIVLIVILLLWIIKTYNKLVKLRNNVKDQWSQVDVQLKKRFDLIPNIVEAVKGYTKHEKETLETVINARNSAISAKAPKDEMKANEELTGALNRLFALSEAYPELKVDNNFKVLQENLKDVEDKISYSRQFYNDTVLKYKNEIETFPTVVIAGLLGFKQEQFFEANSNEKDNVRIQF